MTVCYCIGMSANHGKSMNEYSPSTRCLINTAGDYILFTHKESVGFSLGGCFSSGGIITFKISLEIMIVNFLFFSIFSFYASIIFMWCLILRVFGIPSRSSMKQRFHAPTLTAVLIKQLGKLKWPNSEPTRPKCCWSQILLLEGLIFQCLIMSSTTISLPKRSSSFTELVSCFLNP